jgi:DNA-binding phage protein
MPDLTPLRTEEQKDFDSDLDEIAREGARRMLAQALEAEGADYIAGALGFWKALRNVWRETKEQRC